MIDDETKQHLLEGGISNRIVDVTIGATGDDARSEKLKRVIFTIIRMNDRWVSIGLTGVDDGAEVISGDASEGPIEAVMSAIKKTLESVGGFEEYRQVQMPKNPELSDE